MLAGIALVENLWNKQVYSFSKDSKTTVGLSWERERRRQFTTSLKLPHLILSSPNCSGLPTAPSARPTQKSFCKNARLKSVPPNGAMLCNVSPKWVLETYTVIFSVRWLVEQNMPDKGLSLLVISRQSIFLGIMPQHSKWCYTSQLFACKSLAPVIPYKFRGFS